MTRRKAATLLDVAHQLPKELSVAGFDDSLAAYLAPPFA